MSFRWEFRFMRSVPFAFVASLAADFEAVDCFWRESDSAFTGFVAEVWFSELRLAGEFATKWAAVVGYAVKVRCPAVGPGRFVVSVPVIVPVGQVKLGFPSRGSRLQLVR